MSKRVHDDGVEPNALKKYKQTNTPMSPTADTFQIEIVNSNFTASFTSSSSSSTTSTSSSSSSSNSNPAFRGQPRMVTLSLQSPRNDVTEIVSVTARKVRSNLIEQREYRNFPQTTTRQVQRLLNKDLLSFLTNDPNGYHLNTVMVTLLVHVYGYTILP